MNKNNYKLLLAAAVLASASYALFSWPEKTDFTPEEIARADYQRKREAKLAGKTKSQKPGGYFDYQQLIRTAPGKSAPDYPAGYLFTEYQKALATAVSARSEGNDSIVWKERGPSNVPGRTRAIWVDPADKTNSTLFAASVSGGVWKTTNQGLAWENITPNLPNLNVTCLAGSKKNPNVLYFGTGESFNVSTGMSGAGMFRSDDKGKSWKALSITTNDPNFRYMNRLAVDPDNENTVLAATNYGVFRSTDGGQTGSQTLVGVVQDLQARPDNFQTLFAAMNRVGIFRSQDGGKTWKLVTPKITGFLRLEIAVSPLKPDRVCVSAQISETVSKLYISDDNGETWFESKEQNSSSDKNYLGGQGFYDNAITFHPFDTNKVYVAGVDPWEVVWTDSYKDSAPALLSVLEDSTQSFLSFVRVSGWTDWNGQIQLGSNPSKMVSVEIRFGPGKSQKAHRFTVPAGSTSGVPADQYTYRDYVDVPFEVWDVTNNKQLMFSFRDQSNDGVFELIERNDEAGILGREYMFVHSFAYDAEKPSSEITKNGGHEVEQIYNLWPVLTAEGNWDAKNLPESALKINYGIKKLREVRSTIISDFYNKNGGTDKGLHVDHHVLQIAGINADKKTFILINGNDGGPALSYDAGASFEHRGNSYNTTQFYYADKRPGSNEYIGGTQDNGTWKSPRTLDPDAKTGYLKQVGGDGFGVVWHATEPDKMIATTLYNDIFRTTNGGSSWARANSGLSDARVDTLSPFISRLGYSPDRPDVLLAVSGKGVWRSDNFGSSWKVSRPGSKWRYRFVDEDSTRGFNSAQVVVSPANPQIVWAGTGMTPFTALHVSVNNGLSFRPVNNYQVVMGAVSGLAAHPLDQNTAYALFAWRGGPKILRTENTGQSWEDITGFGPEGEVSNNGFPDVAVHCLLVFPHYPEKMWAGTEIGIVETTDKGKSWHLLTDGLPAVAVWDMKLRDNQIVIATHGRGIWTAELPESAKVTGIEQNREFGKGLRIFPNPSPDGRLQIRLDEIPAGKLTAEVFDAAGRSVFRAEQAGKQEFSLNLSRLPKGIYTLRLRSGNKLFSDKLILE